MRKPSLQSVIVFLALFISSCNNVTPKPSITFTPPSESPTNIPIEEKLGCPKAGTPSDVNLPENLNDDSVGEAIYKFIFKYLNEGGNPQNLPEALISKMPAKFELRLQITPLDMNGDNIDELLISIRHNPNSSYSLIFHCSSGYYLEAGGFGSEILSIEDLNGDKNPEIVFRSYWHGSGCLEYFTVAGWSKTGDGGRAIDYFFRPDTPEMRAFPCGTELHIQDLDNDGQKELTFTGVDNIWHTGLPGREFSYLYEVSDMQSYLKVSEKYINPASRAYVLADAQKALDESLGLHDTDTIELYEKAANDETLQDYPSLGYKEKDGQPHAKEYTTAFALFRLVTIYGGGRFGVDQPETTSTIEVLNKRFPSGVPGSEFVDIAKLFISEREAGKIPSIACSVVSLYIEQKYPNLEQEFIWPGVLYYDNGTICPY